MIDRLRTLFFVAAAAAIAGGCAHPELVSMGTASFDVVRCLGEPLAVTPMPDGSERWTYSGGQDDLKVWWLFFRDEKLVSLEQGLQRKHFGAFRPGEWTVKDVWAYWGRATEEREFPLTGKRAWSYRFVDDNGQGRVAVVKFDEKGVVEDLEVTEDRVMDSCAGPGHCGYGFVDFYDPWYCRGEPWYGRWAGVPRAGLRGGSRPAPRRLPLPGR